MIHISINNVADLDSGTIHNTSASEVTIALVSENTCVAGFVSSTLC